MLTLKEFCQLTKLDPEAIKTMRRRHQLPFVRSEARIGLGRRRYTPFEALLTLGMIGLFEGFTKSLTNAAGLIARAELLIWDELDQILDCAAELHSGAAPRNGSTEILVAWLDLADFHQEIFIGTLQDLSSATLELQQPLIREIKCNISRSAAILLRRGKETKIDLNWSDFSER